MIHLFFTDISTKQFTDFEKKIYLACSMESVKVSKPLLDTFIYRLHAK